MAVLSVFWQKKGLGPLGVKTQNGGVPCDLAPWWQLNKDD